MPRLNERGELRELAADYAVRVGRAIAGDAVVSPSPLVGMFVVEHDEEGERNRSGRVDSVVGDKVMVHFFSALDGEPTSIHPVELPDLMSGRWKLYRSYRRFREEGALYWERYYDREFNRHPMPRHEVLRSMWRMELFLAAGALSEKKRDHMLDRIMGGEDPLAVMEDQRPPGRTQ